MKIQSLALFLYILMANHAALAIDPVYEGETGIRANVFATNCLFCHSSELTGDDRNEAPFSVNYDTYEAALNNAEHAIHEVEEMAMPPIGSGFPLLTQEQEDALLAWQQAGYPLSDRSTYDYVTQRLNLPVVIVGESSYSAVLTLFASEQSPVGIGFTLVSANPTSQTSDSAAVFDPQSGLVDLPLVDLFDGMETTGTVSAQMQLFDASSFQFIVTSVE